MKSTTFLNRILTIVFFVSSGGLLHAQTTAYRPDWCKALPRAEYKSLERVPVSDVWFEVYRPAPGVFAIYEPHQSEETIGYLIVGSRTAILFDTGMGISDIQK